MNRKRCDASKWRRTAGFADRRLIRPAASAWIPQVVEYRVGVPDGVAPPGGSTLLYFSDLHWNDAARAKLAAFPEIAKALSPDWIVFGGDLATYACHLREAFEWLKEAFADFPGVPKIAVPGNWDRRRKKWLPAAFWRERYAEAGFRFLVNERLEAGNVLFHGIDEFRGGNPAIDPDAADSGRLNCWLSHSVDALADTLTGDPPKGANIALCGHSHGGQVRIPFFGALTTSSKYWKTFEYGMYELKTADFKMIVSSGLGESRFPLRIFCPPEIVSVVFERKGRKEDVVQ